MIAVVDHAEGAVVPVRAQPGARRNAIVGLQGDALKIAVTAPADQGKANKALTEMLCKCLGVKRAQVELIAGPASRDKKFLVRGLNAEEVRAKLRGSYEV